MDKNQVRDLLLTGFKPKQQDIATPYLTLPDGTSLDGELRLVGLSGKEAIDLRQMATIQRFDKEGTAINELDGAKYTALMLIRCLYHRASGEPLLNQIIPESGNAADLQSVLGIDAQPFQALVDDLNVFLGMNKTAVADAKKNSETPPTDGNDSSSSNSPENSSGSDPLTN